jgi:hypothetical protein
VIQETRCSVRYVVGLLEAKLPTPPLLIFDDQFLIACSSLIRNRKWPVEIVEILARNIPPHFSLRNPVGPFAMTFASNKVNTEGLLPFSKTSVSRGNHRSLP